MADVIEWELRLTGRDLIQKSLLYQQPCTLLAPTSRQYGRTVLALQLMPRSPNVFILKVNRECEGMNGRSYILSQSSERQSQLLPERRA